MSVNYSLDGHTPVPETDVERWAMWFESIAEQRRVAFDLVGPARVSTVFLGIDHNFSGTGPPVLFETMVFWSDHELNEAQDRYCTWEAAEAGHARMVAQVRAAQEGARP